MINIVLIEPEIPQNAGNIVRTCSAIGAVLYMVKPLGFKLEDKYYKRAGMDYLDFSQIRVVESFEEILNANQGKQFYFASTKSQKRYCDVLFPNDCFIVFGPESRGISEELLNANYSNCIRIPMDARARSLNLSNSVAIIAYEAMKQQNFEGLQEFGKLTKF